MNLLLSLQVNKTMVKAKVVLIKFKNVFQLLLESIQMFQHNYLFHLQYQEFLPLYRFLIIFHLHFSVSIPKFSLNWVGASLNKHTEYLKFPTIQKLQDLKCIY